VKVQLKKYCFFIRAGSEIEGNLIGFFENLLYLFPVLTIIDV